MRAAGVEAPAPQRVSSRLRGGGPGVQRGARRVARGHRRAALRLRIADDEEGKLALAHGRARPSAPRRRPRWPPRRPRWPPRRPSAPRRRPRWRRSSDCARSSRSFRDADLSRARSASAFCVRSAALTELAKSARAARHTAFEGLPHAVVEGRAGSGRMGRVEGAPWRNARAAVGRGACARDAVTRGDDVRARDGRDPRGGRHTPFGVHVGGGRRVDPRGPDRVVSVAPCPRSRSLLEPVLGPSR
jgi:hypothetical protein